MRREGPIRGTESPAWWVCTVALFLATAVGCGGRESAAPRIALGKDLCATCGMTVADPRFAAATREDHTVRAYDSVECLVRALRRTGGSAHGEVWVADFPSGELVPGGAATLVQAGYPSPMGGGLAAFADSARAREESAARGGVTGSLADAVRGALAKEPSP